MDGDLNASLAVAVHEDELPARPGICRRRVAGAKRGKVGACAASGSPGKLVPVSRKGLVGQGSHGAAITGFPSPCPHSRRHAVPRGPQPEVTVAPPVLVVEILSPDDSYTETQSRSADYLHMGVPCVWIIDPTSRTGRQCIGDAWTAADKLEVPGTKIQVNLLELFADLDED